MATYITKKCPYCGYIYQNHKRGDLRKYGCPYLTCTCCHNRFWDDDIVEPALHGYSNAHEIAQSIKRIFIVLINFPMGLFMICAGIDMFRKYGEMIGLFPLAIGGFNIGIILLYSKQIFDNHKHKKDIICEQQRDYDASMVRLQNTYYLTALAKYDSRAEKLLQERTNNQVEHYAKRPELK